MLGAVCCAARSTVSHTGAVDIGVTMHGSHNVSPSGTLGDFGAGVANAAFEAPPELDEQLFDLCTEDAGLEYADEDVFDFAGDMGQSAYH